MSFISWFQRSIRREQSRARQYFRIEMFVLAVLAMVVGGFVQASSARAERFGAGGAIFGAGFSLLLAEFAMGKERKRHDHERDEDAKKISDLRTLVAEQSTRIEEQKDTIKRIDMRSLVPAELKAHSAYGLGKLAVTFAARGFSQDNVPYIATLFADVGISVSDDEEKFLRSHCGAGARARDASHFIQEKAHRLSQDLWCFFDLGRKTTELQGTLSRATSMRDALEDLKTLRENPCLSLVPSLAELTDVLINILEPFKHELPNENRDSVRKSVDDVISGMSVVFIQPRDIAMPYKTTKWIRAFDNGAEIRACIIDVSDKIDEHLVMRVLDDRSTYAMSRIDRFDCSTKITYENGEWNCSLCSQEDTTKACLHIGLARALRTEGIPELSQCRAVVVRKA